MFEFDPTARIALCGVVWIAILILALRSLSTRGYPTTGITFAFFGSYTSLHIGAFVYLTDGYDPTLDPYLASFGHTPTTVALGFEASTLAMLCALGGCRLADTLAGARQIGPVQARPPLSVFKNGAWILIAVGLCGTTLDIFFTDISSALPGFQALISSCRNLFVIGGVLLSWHETLAGRWRNAAALAVFFMLVVPAVVLVRTAILADSIFIGLAAFSFFLSVLSRRGQSSFLPNVALVASLAVAGFFFSAAWLEFRGDLRAVIWNGGTFADAAESLSKGGKTDIQNSSDSSMQKTLYAIDSRLNQNLFVGLAIQKLDALPDTYEEGSTITLALLGWVPRIFWPGKPERGGAAMITKHTGKQTDGKTSFGTGLVFEFYVNFGYISVVIGFLAVGFLVRMIDALTCRALLFGQITFFAMYELMGYALLQPGVDLVFIVAGMAAAVVVSAIMSPLIAYVTALRPSSITARRAQFPGQSEEAGQRRPRGVVTRSGER